MDSPWKIVFGSVAGTSHARTGSPCQDYAAARTVEVGGRAAVVLVCADGAGSAACAEEGSRLACQEFLAAAAAALEGGLAATDVTEDAMRGWCERARRRLGQEATDCGRELADFACTLLAAVVGDESAVFAQMGDGAIVYRDGDEFQLAFWPQGGEFANTTNFLTGPGYERHLVVRTVSPGPDEAAIFSDGLQPLALRYQERAVHGPFFEPMFATLRRELDPDRLRDPLRQFLGSQPVTDRTDDDTTLILATRRPPDHATDQPV